MTKTIEVSKDIAQELHGMVGRIIELQAEIESLKCCGNCEWWEVETYRCVLPNGEHVSRDYKCDKWKKL